MTILREIADGAHEVARDTSAHTFTEVGRHVLDTTACIVSGATHPLARPWLRLLRRVAGGGGRAGSQPLGASGTWPLLTAIGIDATLAHVDEFDALHTRAGIAPAAVVVAPTLLLGATLGESGDAVARAIVSGYQAMGETSLRFGGAALYSERWWPTALFGAVGAAAASSELLGLDAAGRGTALALAVTGLGGLLSDGELGHGHYLLCGMAAARGAWAALAAQAGLTASMRLLDGPAAVALGRAPATQPSGRIHLTDTALKRWPCARPLHTALTALEELRGDGHLVGVGTQVEIALPTPLLNFVTTDPRPAGPVEAAASAAVVVAGSVAGRAEDPGWYREVALHRLNCAQPSVRLTSTPALDAAFPERWGAQVTVRSGAASAVRAVMVAPGDPARPLSSGQLLTKASRLTGLAEDQSVLSRLLDVARAPEIRTVRAGLDEALTAERNAS